ncbi:hypothetical protein GCM10023336_07650 [Streptomyces similanensis]|uniref:Uncharacterized protein n=1 Tax=Streptomyces similanensis TaxID=1274988 RepID=A0ABP9JWW2_9ACTN
MAVHRLPPDLTRTHRLHQTNSYAMSPVRPNSDTLGDGQEANVTPAPGRLPRRPEAIPAPHHSGRTGPAAPCGEAPPVAPVRYVDRRGRRGAAAWGQAGIIRG